MNASFSDADTPLLARALRCRWAISDEKRHAILDHMVAVAGNRDNPDAAVRAFNALVNAEKLDLEAASLALKASVAGSLQALVAGDVAALTGNRLPGAIAPIAVSEDELADGVRRLLEACPEGTRNALTSACVSSALAG